MRNASTMSDNVKTWITAEAEPLFYSTAPSQQIVLGHVEYPNIISAVLDCVANMALLTLGRTVRFLCHARLRWSTLPEQAKQHQLECSEFLDKPEIMEQRRQRAMTAFEFVKRNSSLAAQPLEFGLRSVDSSGFGGSIDLLDN